MRTIKIFLFILRSVFISVEFLCVIVGAFIHWALPEVERMLPDISTSADGFKYVCFLPPAFAVYAAKIVNDILTPNHELRSCLCSWKDRYILTIYAYVALGYSLVSSACAICVYALKDSCGGQPLVIVLSIVIGFVAMASAYMARHKLIASLDKMKEG